MTDALERSRALWNRDALDLESDEVLAQLLDRGETAAWRDLYRLAQADMGLRARIHRLVLTVPVALPHFWLAALASLGARRCREGTLSGRERDRALAALSTDIASVDVVELLPEVSQRGAALVVRHALRTGDAIQLASCLYLRPHTASELQLLAYDTRLNEAARAEGVPLAASA